MFASIPDLNVFVCVFAHKSAFVVRRGSSLRSRCRLVRSRCAVLWGQSSGRIGAVRCAAAALLFCTNARLQARRVPLSVRESVCSNHTSACENSQTRPKQSFRFNHCSANTHRCPSNRSRVCESKKSSTESECVLCFIVTSPEVCGVLLHLHSFSVC